MYNASDFTISVKIGSSYMPIVSYINGQEPNLQFVFNENLQEEENSQYTLTFDVADSQYEGGVKIFCPFLHLLYIGADLRLTWNYTYIDFVISNVAPQRKQNGAFYSFTAKDEVSYRWQKQHLGYNFSTVDSAGNLNVQNIYEISRTVLKDNLLLYDPVSNQTGWKIVSFTGDVNNDYNNSIGYQSLIRQKFSLEVEDSNPFNVIIEACSTANAYLKIDYKTHSIDFFRKNDVKDSGYRYRPDYNLLSYSADYSGEELCTILHAHGGTDANGNIVTIIPPLSYALKKYVEEKYDNLFPNNSWDDVKNTIYQEKGILKSEYQPTFEEEALILEMHSGDDSYDEGVLTPVAGQGNYQDLTAMSTIARFSVNESLTPIVNSVYYTNIDGKYTNCPQQDTLWSVISRLQTSCYEKNFLTQHYHGEEIPTTTDKPYQCYKINIGDAAVWPGRQDGQCSTVIDFCFDKDVDVRVGRYDALFDTENGDKEACNIQIKTNGNQLDISYKVREINASNDTATIKELHEETFTLNSKLTSGRWKHLIIKSYFNFDYDEQLKHKMRICTTVCYNGQILDTKEFSMTDKIGQPDALNLMSNLFGDTSSNSLQFIIANSGTNIYSDPDNTALIGSIDNGYIGEINFIRQNGDPEIGYGLPENFFSSNEYTNRYFNNSTISWKQVVDNKHYNYYCIYRAIFNPGTSATLGTLKLRQDTDNPWLSDRRKQNTLETEQFLTMADYVPYLGQYLMDFSYFKPFRVIDEDELQSFKTELQACNFKQQYETMTLLQARSDLQQYRSELESLAETYAGVIYNLIDADVSEADEGTNNIIQQIKNKMYALGSNYRSAMKSIGQSFEDEISRFDANLIDDYFTNLIYKTQEQISKYRSITRDKDNPESLNAQENINILQPFCYDTKITIILDSESIYAPSAYGLINKVLASSTVVAIDDFPYNIRSYYNATQQELQSLWQNFYIQFGHVIYEQTYENQDELDSIGLYNQALTYMSDYNKIKGAYSTTVFDIATLDNIGHPKAEVGDFIYVYSPASLQAFPLMRIINEIEEKQNTLQHYKDIFNIGGVSITTINALQEEIATLKVEAKEEYKALYGIQVEHYQQLLSLLYTDKLYITSISRVLREPLKDSITVEEQSQYKNIITKLIKNI